MWISAANDRGQKKLESSNNPLYYRCRGCYYLLHRELDQGGLRYKQWQRAFRDPYILLITFGGLLFFSWSVTGILGALVNDASSSKTVISSSYYSILLQVHLHTYFLLFSLLLLLIGVNMFSIHIMIVQIDAPLILIQNLNLTMKQ